MRTTLDPASEFELAYGYSRAVRVGSHIFVSGTTASPQHLKDDAHRQLLSAIGIAEAALQRLGAKLSDVVRSVVYIVDMKDLDLVARAHTEVFGTVRPASTLVQVTALTPVEARVEIELTAQCSDPSNT